MPYASRYWSEMFTGLKKSIPKVFQKADVLAGQNQIFQIGKFNSSCKSQTQSAKVLDLLSQLAQDNSNDTQKSVFKVLSCLPIAADFKADLKLSL